jgi:RND family efflux transporter MFP subunit
MPHETHSPPPNSPRPSSRALKIVASVGIAVVVVVVAIGITTRAMGKAKQRQWTDDRAVPTVSVIQPNALSADSILKLPGRIEAYSRAPIYARVSGYLKSYDVDIGTHVHAGQLLGTIETPDLDQQFAQAKADLTNAKANASLAGTTYKRWKSMLDSDSVSRQETDEKEGDLASKQAMVNAAQANVDRLAALEAFKRIVAPFDGVITTRTTDIGALIAAGSNSGPDLFTVSDTHKLRVYVSVPQIYSPAIKEKMVAQLSVPERPGQTFQATVESTSKAVNAESGALLVQLSLDNDQSELLPGGYAEVQINVGNRAATVSVPSSVLIFDASGLHVATVGTDNRVVMKPVKIALDQGKTVQISTGLVADDRVVDSPPDALAQGDQVRIATPAAADKQAGAANAHG